MATKKKTKAAKKTTKRVTAKKAVTLIAFKPTPQEQTFKELLHTAKVNDYPVLQAPHKHVDERGVITNILNKPVGSVVLITTKANTVRANHWHKTDAHVCYVLKGSVHYYERPVGSTAEPRYTLVKVGQNFITGPNVEHAMKFTEETEFLTLGLLSRTPAEYEDDLIRLQEPNLLSRPSAVELEPKDIINAPAAVDTTTPPAAGA